MSTIKKVAQNTTLYFLSSLILRASSIIFFPIFSFYLTKEDYGILFVTQSITAVVVAFSGLEIHRAVTRFIYDGTIKADGDEIFSTGIKISVLSNVFWIVLLLIFGEWVLEPVLNDIDFYPYMWVSVIALLFSGVVENYMAYLKAQHKGKASFGFELSYYGCNIALNLLFVVGFKMDVIGLIYSTLLSGVIFCIYVFFHVRKAFSWSIDRDIAGKLLSYALPLVPFTLLGILLTTTDRFLLNSFIGKEASGIFYLAFTMGAVYSTMKEAMYTSFTPWFYQHFAKDNYALIRKIMSYLITGSAIICLGISLFSYEVLTVISSKKEFVQAWKYVPFISSGFLIVFAGQLFSLPIFHSKQTKHFWLGNLGGFLVTAGGGYVLIRDYGFYGILVAKVLGYAVMVLIQYWLAIRLSDFRPRVAYAAVVLLLTFVLSFAHYLPINYVLLLVIKAGLALSVTSVFVYYLKSRYFPGLSLPSIASKLMSYR